MQKRKQPVYYEIFYRSESEEILPIQPYPTCHNYIPPPSPKKVSYKILSRLIQKVSIPDPMPQAQKVKATPERLTGNPDKAAGK